MNEQIIMSIIHAINQRVIVLLPHFDLFCLDKGVDADPCQINRQFREPVMKLSASSHLKISSGLWNKVYAGEGLIWFVSEKKGH